MKIDTPKDISTHMLSNPEQYITRVGGGKTSLDELLNIINILKGKIIIISLTKKSLEFARGSLA